MPAAVQTALIDAMNCQLMHVECEYTRGFSGLVLIGNASEVCKNGVERAKAALEIGGISLPQKRMLMSITPADLRKDGSHFDLPFAMALALLSTQKMPLHDPGDWLFAAELSLQGQLRPVKGIISFALAAITAGLKGIVIARDNFPEVATLTQLGLSGSEDFAVLGFDSLQQVIDWMFAGSTYRGPTHLTESGHDALLVDSCQHKPNFDDMLLDRDLERVALAAAVGLHSLLLYGAPGTGKSMFSARLTSIMPPMSNSFRIDALKIHSLLSQKLTPQLLSGRPPFRSPHHQASSAALMGVPSSPGEISLAHGGVLFLDEFPEFRRDLVEALREPLETGCIQVSRAKHKVVWKSEIMLVAAANPCPCGWLGSSKKRCSCPIPKILTYRRKISGPILDRIDLHLNMKESQGSNPELFFARNVDADSAPSVTRRMAGEVIRARAFAAERNRKFDVTFNRDLESEHLLAASGHGQKRFAELVTRFFPDFLSRRAMVRCLRVARTLADLDGEAGLKEQHFAQAIAWTPEACSQERGDHAFGLG